MRALSIRHRNRTTRCLRPLRQFILEWCSASGYILGKRLEWRRFLYRSFWTQVRSFFNSQLACRSHVINFLRFERELEALRKELADSTARSGRSSPNSLDTASGGPSDEDLLTPAGSPFTMDKELPVTPDNVSDAALADKKAR
jgi:hypothetical protein